MRPDVLPTIPKPLDWVKGQESGIQAQRSVPDWSLYMPDGEPQSTLADDSDACATFSGPEHCIEAQVNYDLAHGNYPKEAVDYFTSAGYMYNGKFRTSPLFNAKMNGTTQQGNYMNAVAESARTVGLLPWVDLPFPEKFLWSQFNTLVIPQAMLDKAKKILKYISINYQWLSRVPTAQDLLLAPIQIATGVCAGWYTDTPVKACGAPMMHCTCLYNMTPGLEHKIRDTYLPWDKVLDWDYPIYASMQYVVHPVTITMPKKPVFITPIQLAYGSHLVADVENIQTFLAWDGELEEKYICGVFGPRTLQAVNDFQLKYKNDILTPLGLSKPTGIWGKACQKKAVQLLLNN